MIKNHYMHEITLQSTLRIGAILPQIRNVQEWLNLWRYLDPNWKYIVTVDGEFGTQTERVVKEFQKKMALKVDGIVNLDTFNELTRPMANAFSVTLGDWDVRRMIVYYAEQHAKNQPKELYNSNRGPWVRAYMDGNEGREWAWCMGFVQTILDQAFSTLGRDYLKVIPRTFSCDLVADYGKKSQRVIDNFRVKKNPQLIEPGDIFLIRDPGHENNWTHTGIITHYEGDWIYTVEGNTNDEGSREGFEVCYRMRNYSKCRNIDLYKIDLYL